MSARKILQLCGLAAAANGAIYAVMSASPYDVAAVDLMSGR